MRWNKEREPDIKYMMWSACIHSASQATNRPEPLVAFLYIHRNVFHTWKHLLTMGIWIQSLHLLGADARRQIAYKT